MQLDVVYRPIAWVMVVPPAALLGALLFWLGHVYVAPLPPVVAWLGHAAFFWMRGDRPCQVQIADERVVLDDPRRGQRLAVETARVHAANLTLRQRDDGGTTALLVLWDETRPLLALRLAVPRTTPRDEEVDGDLISASVGGDGGTAYAFAPVGAVGRQLIRDPNGAVVAWYRALPREVRERTPVRVWRGQEPALDLLGRHDENWDGVLLLESDAAILDGAPVDAAGWQWGHSTRQAMLLQVPDGSQGFSGATLDLGVLRIGGHTVAFPAGLAEDLGDAVALDETSLHTHSGEGAAVLYHLLRHTPRGRWPQPLVDALHEARAILGGEPGAVA